MEMADLSPQRKAEGKNLSESGTRYTDSQDHAEPPGSRQVTRDGDDVALAEGGQPVEYRVYRVRWFGLTQLILLNIVVSWDVSRSIGPGGRELLFSMTDLLTAVAFLLCRCQYSSRFLLYET